MDKTLSILGYTVSKVSGLFININYLIASVDIMIIRSIKKFYALLSIPRYDQGLVMFEWVQTVQTFKVEIGIYDIILLS